MQNLILHTLQDRLQVLNYLGVVGDSKTYDHLHALET